MAGTATGAAPPVRPAAPPVQQAVIAPPTSTTAAAATGAAPASPVGMAADPAPEAGTMAEPKNQTIQVSVAPVQKKKYAKKSARHGRADNEPGPSQEQEKEAEAEIISRSLSLSKLRDTRKDFSHHPGKHIITWLLRCWDNGASILELEGKEAKQLGSLAMEGGIDKVI